MFLIDFTRNTFRNLRKLTELITHPKPPAAQEVARRLSLHDRDIFEPAPAQKRDTPADRLLEAFREEQAKKEREMVKAIRS